MVVAWVINISGEGIRGLGFRGLGFEGFRDQASRFRA